MDNLKGKLTLKQAQEIMEKTGGSLDLEGTQITALPDNLTVGSYLDLRGTQITAEERKKVKHLKNGDYVPKRYLYADEILTHIKAKRTVKGYVFYQGKIKNKNVVYDGKNYAHCKTFRDGVVDLLFKSADRDTSKYKNLSLDSEVSCEDAIVMYRIITGACRQGTEAFLQGLGKLKEQYTVNEIIDLTDGQYGHKTFKAFFETD